MATERSQQRIDRLQSDVMDIIADENIDLPVTGDRGIPAVVVAFDDEPLSMLLQRISGVGGYANIFLQGSSGLRQMSAIPAACAIFEQQADDMTATPPSALASVGMFFDYVATQEAGVKIPARPTIPTGIPSEVRFAAGARPARKLAIASV